MTPEDKKEAKRLYDIEYRKLKKDKIAQDKRDWVKANPDKIKNSRLRNKDKKKIWDKRYSQNNVDRCNKIKKKWAETNPEKKTKANSDYVRKRLLNDILYKIKHYTRVSISGSIKRNGYSKKSKTHEILGCSYEDFKLHLESKFETWMTWNNYGNWSGIPTELNTSWDIDHIIPTSSAKTEEDVLMLNHYTNLQPLCSYTNRWVKSDN